MMLALMVAVLGLTACGGDDDDEDGGGYDDNEYFEITINGEKYVDEYWCGSGIVNLAPKQRNGMEVYAYGGVSNQIPISYQDGLQYHVIAGYTTEDMKQVFQNSTGTYEVISNRGQYIVTDYSDNVGMVISGGNMSRRTVTSGSMKITKVGKFKDPSAKAIMGREDSYVTEGTFSFILTDDWNGNEYEISGKFRLIF